MVGSVRTMSAGDAFRKFFKRFHVLKVVTVAHTRCRRFHWESAEATAPGVVEDSSTSPLNDEWVTWGHDRSKCFQEEDNLKDEEGCSGRDGAVPQGPEVHQWQPLGMIGPLCLQEKESGILQGVYNAVN